MTQRPAGFEGPTVPMTVSAAPQRPDALGATVPAQVPIAHPASKRFVLVAAAASAGLAGIFLGIVIGRASKSSVVAAAPAQLAQLGVTSKPVDANVVVDGRFVGVSPVERIDLEAGKHSVVIDAFGYQPYAGTLEIEAKGRATLKVVLAPIGDTKATTNGEFAGTKAASTKIVPATALAPMSMTGTGTSKEGAKETAPKPSRSSSYTPPRPRRDCSGEKSRCRDSCSSADFSCRSACPYCTGCVSNMTYEQCRSQCDTCKQGCEQNVKFCESRCDNDYNSCSASQ